MESMQMKPCRTASWIVAAAALLGPISHAAERVTLRNGFVQRCDHHGQVEGRVRLYLTADEDNYIELAPEEIVSVEFTPDPPVPAQIKAPDQTASAPEAKLSDADLHQILAAASGAHNLDVDLLASVVKEESDGDARAVSRAGAQGLMQLMPATAVELGVENSFQPDQNVRGGSAYLDALLVRYHDNLALALAAYNAGPAAVDKYRGVPPYRETRIYVARVIHEFNRRVLERQAEAKRALVRSTAQSASKAQ
jgi:soluble lytic murein transglycosylase-like protein